MDNKLYYPYLLVNWGERGVYPYGLKGGEKELKRLEQFLSNRKGWKFAYVIDPKLPKQNNILHYYHPSRGTTHLDKEEYTSLVKKNYISIYIVPTQAEKRRTGSIKGQCRKIRHLDELEQYKNNTRIQHILVYNEKGKVSHTYENGTLICVNKKTQ